MQSKCLYHSQHLNSLILVPLFRVYSLLLVLICAFTVQHKGTDAIMALACNYPTIYYKRFVGSLRKFGYTEDIVLAVSPVEKMKPGVEAYVKETGVVAYGFDVDCKVSSSVWYDMV